MTHSIVHTKKMVVCFYLPQQLFYITVRCDANIEIDGGFISIHFILFFFLFRFSYNFFFPFQRFGNIWNEPQDKWQSNKVSNFVYFIENS